MRRAAPILSLCLLGIPGAQGPVSGPAELEVVVTSDGVGSRLDGADVEVQYLPRATFVRQFSSGQKCRTENGRCRFRVTSGNHLVIVSKPGYYDAVDPLSPRYAEQVMVTPLANFRLEVPMIPAGSVSGAVFTEDGKPAAQAFVRARLATGQPGRLPLHRWAYTNGKGEFWLENLPPGRYGLFLVAPESVRFRSLQRSEITGEFTGYAVQMFHPGIEESSWVTPVDITPGLHLEHRTVVMRRFKVYSITGALIDPATREPLLAATVALRTGDEYNSEIFPPRPVRSDGSFEFHSLGPGAYNLLVYRSDREIPWIVPCVVTPTSQPDLLLQVPEWHPLVVDVSSARRLRMQTGARLMLDAEIDAGQLVSRIGEPGPVLMGQLPPGRYRLHMESEDGVYLLRARQGDFDAIGEDVLVTEGGAETVEAQISDETGEFFGTLVDREGEPVQRGWVVLVPADPRRRARGDLNRQLRVDTNGRFLLPMVPPGQYWLLGFPERPAGGFNNAAFWAEYEREALKIPLRPGDRIPVGLPVTPRH